MDGIDVTVAIVFLIAFLSGITMGIVLIVSVGSRREDRLYSLTDDAPDAMTRGVRRFVGAGSRGMGFRPAGQEPDQARGPDW